MRLKEIKGIHTLKDCADLSEGYYLMAYKLPGVDKLSRIRIDVLKIDENEVKTLGGVFLHDREPESPVSEIYKIY